MSEIAVVLAFVAGLQLGLYLDRLSRTIKKLDKPAPKTGATNPYKRTTEWIPPHEPGKTSGVVRAKTPARLQFEAEEQTRKDSEHWGIMPK